MDIRNIKFKAKCLSDGKWLKGNFVHRATGDYIVLGECRFSVDPNTVCQFTGLKDKDGNDVWEHDFLVSPCLKGEIIFNNGCFRIKKDDGSSYPFTTLIIIDGKIDYCCVVGNKFDRKDGEK